MPRTTRKIGFLCAFLLLAGCPNPTLLLPGKQLVGPTESVDSFAFAQQFSVLQLELNPDQPYSVNLRVTVIDGNLYIDASKQRRWYRHLKENNQVRIKLGSVIYTAKAVVEHRGEVTRQFLSKHIVFRLEPF
jgi:hypothetical protein|tara:strand:+ start:265 stop:660 length:396 start_codon:yes stop_codon:yes gene_type:complete